MATVQHGGRVIAKNMIVHQTNVAVPRMRQDKRLDKPQWTERGRYYARRVAAINAFEQMDVDVMICKYCGEAKEGPVCKRCGHVDGRRMTDLDPNRKWFEDRSSAEDNCEIGAGSVPKPDPHMVNESREAYARGDFMTTEELLEDIRKRKFMEENGLGPEDMELDI